MDIEYRFEMTGNRISGMYIDVYKAEAETLALDSNMEKMSLVFLNKLICQSFAQLW